MSASSSSLGSSPLSSMSDVELPDVPHNIPPLDSFFSDKTPLEPEQMSQTSDEREKSPMDEPTLADNPDIAFLVMFRARFSEAFPPKLQHYGPQDIERGVVDTIPSEAIEYLLCALLGLVLNRKKPVERGHHTRALEDALSSHKAQWPQEWEGSNPLPGSKTFNTMNPKDRLILLRALVIWSLNSSEIISNIIKDSYKQNRHDDDLNQPLSVHSWGRDKQKRSYYLIEGKDDTPFRLYRESRRYSNGPVWRNVAGSIYEMKEVADSLEKDGSQHAKKLSINILNSLQRFEATEEKRKRREYRQSRKTQFRKPDPGFYLYEGRTRGKRMKYTYSDDEESYANEENTDATDQRRSSRGMGGDGGMTTSSGRQVRTRYGNLIGTHDNDLSDGPSRSRRNTNNHSLNEDGDTSSGGEWQSGDNPDDEPDDDSEDEEEEKEEDNESESISGRGKLKETKSLIVTLQYGTHSKPPVTNNHLPVKADSNVVENQSSPSPLPPPLPLNSMAKFLYTPAEQPPSPAIEPLPTTPVLWSSLATVDKPHI